MAYEDEGQLLVEFYPDADGEPRLYDVADLQRVLDTVAAMLGAGVGGRRAGRRGPPARHGRRRAPGRRPGHRVRPARPPPRPRGRGLLPPGGRGRHHQPLRRPRPGRGGHRGLHPALRPRGTGRRLRRRPGRGLPRASPGPPSWPAATCRPWPCWSAGPAGPASPSPSRCRTPPARCSCCEPARAPGSRAQPAPGQRGALHRLPPDARQPRPGAPPAPLRRPAGAAPRCRRRQVPVPHHQHGGVLLGEGPADLLADRVVGHVHLGPQPGRLAGRPPPRRRSRGGGRPPAPPWPAPAPASPAGPRRSAPAAPRGTAPPSRTGRGGSSPAAPGCCPAVAYSRWKLSGWPKSTCRVVTCQRRPMASRTCRSILGP